MKMCLPIFRCINRLDYGLPYVSFSYFKSMITGLLVILIVAGYSLDLAAQNGRIKGLYHRSKNRRTPFWRHRLPG